MSLILSGTDGLSDVDGSAATPAIRGTDANTGIFFPAADTIAFAEGGTEAMRIDSSGNVGIGTSSPSTKLDVNSGTLGYALTLQAATDTSRKYQLGIQSNGLSFYDTTAAAVRMVIDTSGNVTVGSAVAATNRTIIINGVANKAGRIDFQESGATKWLVGNGAASENGVFQIYDNTNGTGVQLSRGATSWAAISDERLKDIIEPITDAATKVATLRAVIGKYKTDKEEIRRSFLIAQDVQAVLPEAVDSTNTEQLEVRYTEVIPLLVAAIKEQQALITTLTDRITALEAK